MYDLNFEDFYSENPDELSTFEKWKPAIELAAMIYKSFQPDDTDDDDDTPADVNRQSRARDAGDLDSGPTMSNSSTLSSVTTNSNSTTTRLGHDKDDDYLLDFDSSNGNINPVDRSSSNSIQDDNKNNRCPPLSSSKEEKKTSGRREGRQLLPGLFFDETSEHPFIILLQYVVPLVSVDLPVLLPTNLRNLDRSKPTLAGGFQAIP